MHFKKNIVLLNQFLTRFCGDVTDVVSICVLNMKQIMSYEILEWKCFFWGDCQCCQPFIFNCIIIIYHKIVINIWGNFVEKWFEFAQQQRPISVLHEFNYYVSHTHSFASFHIIVELMLILMKILWVNISSIITHYSCSMPLLSSAKVKIHMIRLNSIITLSIKWRGKISKSYEFIFIEFNRAYYSEAYLAATIWLFSMNL